MLEQRERAAESGFVHERDVAFQAHARRDRMFGRWVGHLIGLSGAAADDYGRTLMLSNVEGGSDETLLAAVRTDLAKHGVFGVRATEERLQRKLERLGALADAHLRG
ncbi:ATPase inhibitor subunit zeta [Hansschlegelia zhihuaiae]|nr:ATPase inhibitor subunit zeta [Hansschlegelia zhihuaiae]